VLREKFGPFWDLSRARLQILEGYFQLEAVKRQKLQTCLHNKFLLFLDENDDLLRVLSKFYSFKILFHLHVALPLRSEGDLKYVKNPCGNVG